ncbi:MAG: FtsX-like permease family protein [Bacteroidetes bacterium]|nr:FtsX-like permease family protein [Bacteroidota bacterium]
MVNKFRSILTALGIIFGVAAVITMMSIGNGARKEILDQMKMVGVNNIVISPIINYSTEDSGEEGKSASKQFSPGLTLKDAESIKSIIPTVVRTSPEVTYEASIIKDGKKGTAQLNGVTADFFEVYNLKIEEGSFFNDEQFKNGSSVCIIGPSVKSRFFPQENPIGKNIKCGQIWLTVIGILETQKFSQNTSKDLGISDYNENIYAPLQTLLLRYQDRSIALKGSSSTSIAIMGGRRRGMHGGGVVSISSSSSGSNQANTNQLDKLIIQVENTEQLNVTTQVINQILLRRHHDVMDFEIKIPELLLRQEQRTKDIFNIVLGAIASISLIVGGIGIMNIMLASVMERIREIGVRMATGARKSDITYQFISEATIISISGGLIGIILGVLLSKGVMQATDILTIISWDSVLISFGVSATVGILFGYMPAKKAAEQDPVTSLRHD